MAHSFRAWAVVVKNTDDVPFTRAPAILGGGTIYQIYAEEQPAREFCRIRFGDAKYVVRKCRVYLE